MNKSIEFTIQNIVLPIDEPEYSAITEAKKQCEHLISQNAEFKIYKKSVDMRNRQSPKFVYSVSVLTEYISDAALSKIQKMGFKLADDGEINFDYGNEKPNGRFCVIGFGPAGMFASLLLAEHGYAPLVIERGGSVDERIVSTDNFIKNKILDTESNIQFGAGGAGTFSDGKLMTRINDRLCRKVIKTFADFGAPKEILTCAKPHIGTDNLVSIVKNIASRITSLGGEIMYNTRVDDISSDAKGTLLTLSNGEKIRCCCAVFATGHSARDTYKMLLSKNITVEAKAFSVGVRIEHLQKDIEKGLYGNLCEKYGNILPKGEYALSHRNAQRGVYTFCMCPGGVVIPSSSDTNEICTNGMSKYKRDGKNSNSAVCVSVLPSDYGNTPLGAIEFQKHIENKAFLLGGSSYTAPSQSVGSFLHGEQNKITRIEPSYMNGDVKLTDISSLFPAYITEMLKMGIMNFDKKIPGFACHDAILTAPETRTSAPVRIIRTDSGFSPDAHNIYPCGEGAGYAGGITSAATDGIKTAIKIMERFSHK